MNPFAKRVVRARKLREKHGMTNLILQPDKPETIERDEFGNEMLTVGGAAWLRAFCTVLMRRGFAQRAWFEGDPVKMWLTNLEGATSFADIPNGAINARDYKWILLRFMAHPAAKHLINLEKEMTGY